MVFLNHLGQTIQFGLSNIPKHSLKSLKWLETIFTDKAYVKDAEREKASLAQVAQNRCKAYSSGPIDATDDGGHSKRVEHKN